jgi:hypothetical protein
MGNENDNKADRDPFRRRLAKLPEFLGERFRSSGLPRKLVLGLSWIILLTIGSVSGIWTYGDLTKSRSAIVASDKFAIATLAIAFFAAVFALLAYQVSTGPPNLELRIMLEGQEDRTELNLRYVTDSKRRGELAAWFGSADPSSEDPESLWNDPKPYMHIAYMWLYNRSGYPARSPAVILRFGNDHTSMGLCWTQRESYNLDGRFKDITQGPTWKGAEWKTPGTVVLAAQWDGGSEYTIHGKSERRLPDLALVSLFSRELTSMFKAELLAENFRKVVDIEIVFVIDTPA